MNSKKAAPAWAHALILALVLSPCVAIGAAVTGEDVTPAQARSAPSRPDPRERPVAAQLERSSLVELAIEGGLVPESEKTDFVVCYEYLRDSLQSRKPHIGRASILEAAAATCAEKEGTP